MQNVEQLSQLFTEYPEQLGTTVLQMDFAGTVEAVGDGVTDYSVGDEVSPAP